MAQTTVEPMEQIAAEARQGGRDLVLATGKVTRLIIDADMWRFAEGLCKGGLTPKGLDRPGAIIGIIQAGAEIGLPPMAALSGITFVNGRLGIMGRDARALVRDRGGLKPGTQIKLRVEGDSSGPTKDWADTVCGHAWCWPKGYDEPVEYRFTVSMAKRAGLWMKAGPWTQYPERMLMERAWGFVFGDHFKEYFNGLHSAEENDDIEARVERARDVTGSSGSAAAPPDGDPLLDDAAPARELEVVTGERNREPEDDGLRGVRWGQRAAADPPPPASEPAQEEEQGRVTPDVPGGPAPSPAPASEPEEGRLF